MKQNRRKLRVDKHAQESAAAELAIAALTFIAEDPERLGRFIALTGIEPESLRSAATHPGFLLGVLDHVAGDETLLLAFAEFATLDPADVMRARDVLGGEPSP